MNKLKKILSLTALIVFALPLVMLTGCGGGGTGSGNNNVEITIEGGGKITLELYPEMAPETVANFKKLADEKFYDGIIFHRIMKGFMIQGGDPTGTGTGGSSETIKGEFSSNGFSKNTLSHKRGVISMARSNVPDSASSQFFIVHEDSEFLDGNYAAFGKVIEGMDEVDRLANLPVEASASGEPSSPVDPPVIKEIRVVK